jgi:RecJ-like exonuclease
MALIVQQCSACRGDGHRDHLEERTAAGDWVAQDANGLSAELADAWIASDPFAPIRWVNAPCVSCNGSGSVELEFVTCKIF